MQGKRSRLPGWQAGMPTLQRSARSHRRLKPSLKDVLNKDPNGIPAGIPRNLTALSRQVLADLVENGEASLSSAKPAKSEIGDQGAEVRGQSSEDMI